MQQHDLTQVPIVDLACPDGPIVAMIGKPALFGACVQMGLAQPRTIHQMAVERVTLGHLIRLFQLSDKQLSRISKVGETAIQRIRQVQAYVADGEVRVCENDMIEAINA